MRLPPPSKKITGVFYIYGINFGGITGKIGNVVTGNNSWGVNFHRITGKFGRYERASGDVKLGRTIITGNIGYAITGYYSLRINLERKNR